MPREPAPDDADLIREVHDRFRQAQEHESEWRSAALEDMRFLHGDSRNLNQWDRGAQLARQGVGGVAGRPMLTLNKTMQHYLQVVNAAQQQTMGVKVIAVGDQATAKAAEAIEGVIRHIEAHSNAQQNGYAQAIRGQVGSGIGWVHIKPDYVDASSFDQDLRIESVPDPLDVYSDPTCREPDHSDMQWAMLVSTMPRTEFDRTYPRHKDDVGPDVAALDEHQAREWDGKDVVRVAHYYRRSEEEDTLWAVPSMISTAISSSPQMQDGQSQSQEMSSSPSETPSSPSSAPPSPRPSDVTAMRQSQMPPELLKLCRAMGARHRPITDSRVEWVLVGGSRVIDRQDTVFKTIPLVPFVGIETVIEGKLDRKGLVRALIDPQRMFNYAASKFAESLAAQTITPWVIPAGAIDGYENEWNSANTAPRPYLTYNPRDMDTGTPFEPPQRVEPPNMSAGYMQAMQNADLQMQMVTGQFDAEMGRPGNERSGRAINERQRQSDTATYHFTDGQGAALRLIGRVLLEAIPQVYDTTRVIQILGEDGSMQPAVLDPQLGAAHQVVTPPGQPDPGPQDDPDKALAIQGAILAVNPLVGRYDVQADVGPAFATRRQDAFNAISQVIQGAPEIMGKIGDLFFRSADFPLADEIADRLKPPSADPALQQAQQHIQALTVQLAQAQQALKAKGAQQQHEAVMGLMEHQQDSQRIAIDAFKADTDRLAAIGSTDPAALHPALLAAIQIAVQQHLGAAGGGPAPPSVPAAAPGPTAVPRLPSANPPEGPIRAPSPTDGAVS